MKKDFHFYMSQDSLDLDDPVMFHEAVSKASGGW